MDIKEKNKIARAIEKSPVSTQKRVVNFLNLFSDVTPSNSTNFTDEIWRMLYLFVSSKAFLPLDKMKSITSNERYWLAYKNSFSQDERIAMYWINDKRMRLLEPTGPPRNTKVGAHYRVCREQKWNISIPLCIHPSNHGGIPVGLGAFSLVPLKKGQSIAQFTGTVHPISDFKTLNRGERQYYIITCEYGRHHMVVNPLDDLKLHFVGYINEPSALTKNSRVRYIPKEKDLRGEFPEEGVVFRYDSKKREYEVKFEMGDTVIAHPSELVPVNHPQKHIANCIWFDFPVPLECYRRIGPDSSGTMLVFYVKNRYECTVTLPWLDVDEEYEFITTPENGTHAMKRWPYNNIPKNALLTLKEKVYDGLVRQGIVTRVDSSRKTVDVYHRVDENVSWKLPDRILGGKLKRCKSCKKHDDPMCEACTIVAFPVVHACSDIGVGEELLSFYSDKYVLQSRGSPCTNLLSNETVRPLWSDGFRLRQ